MSKSSTITPAEYAKRKRSAIYKTKCRHDRSRTKPEITFSVVLSKLIKFMRSEVGNLSWVSYAKIAEDLPYHWTAIKFHLTAAELIGAVIIKYKTANQAHHDVSKFYPNYTEFTYGQTFPMLIKKDLSVDGKVKPKTLNFYTINRNCTYYDVSASLCRGAQHSITQGSSLVCRASNHQVALPVIPATPCGRTLALC